MNANVTVRHRSASGDLSGDLWEYDKERRVVDVVVRGFGLVIPVCCLALPRVGAYPIRRIDSRGECWRIAPVRFEPAWRRGDELRSVDTPYPLADDDLGRVDPNTLSDFLDLTSAPADVAAALESL